jgi:hypothetical protein
MTLVLRLASALVQFFVVGIIPILVCLPGDRIDTLNKIVLLAAMAKVGLDGVVLASGRQDETRCAAVPIALLAGYLLLTTTALSHFAGFDFGAFAPTFLFSLMSMTFLLHLMVTSHWWILFFAPSFAIMSYYYEALLPAVAIVALFSARIRINIDLRRVFSRRTVLLMLFGAFAPIYSYLSFRYFNGHFPPEIANVLGRLVSMVFLLKGVLNITDWQAGFRGRKLLVGRRGRLLFIGAVAAVAAAGTVDIALGGVLGFAVFFVIGPPYWQVLAGPPPVASAIVLGLALLSLGELAFGWIRSDLFFLACALAAVVLALMFRYPREFPDAADSGHRPLAPGRDGNTNGNGSARRLTSTLQDSKRLKRCMSIASAER